MSFDVDRVVNNILNAVGESDLKVLKNVLNNPPYWSPAIDGQKEAIRRCVAYSTAMDESFIKAYAVLSVNEWGIEQERIIVLTDQNIYRLKFDYEDQSVSLCNKTSLSSITRIEYGRCKPSDFSIAAQLARTELEQQCSFKIYSTSKDGGSSINDWYREAVGGAPKEYPRTYRPFTIDAEEARTVVEEVVAVFTILIELRKQKPGQQGDVEIKNIEMITELPGSMIALTANMLQLGLWNDLGNDDLE